MLDKLELNTLAMELRGRLGEDEKSPVDVFALIGQIPKLTIVQYPLGERISGMCIKEEGVQLLAVNSSMSYGRQRFSIAHELYHLFFDESKGFAICAKRLDSDDEVEKRADCFASYFLAPYGALRMLVQDMKKTYGTLTYVDIIKLEQYFGMSHQAMLWRLVQEGYLDKCEADSMRNNVIMKAKSYGFDEKLYLSTENRMQQRTYGEYIQQAEQLKEKNLISYGKYEELLLDAFRYDIVYGDEENGGELLD